MGIKSNWIAVTAISTAAITVACVVFYQKKIKKLVGKDRRHRYFAEILDDFHVYYNKETDDYKKRLFQPLIYMDSKILSLKKALTIRILEIGTGAGANLDYYPPNSRVIAVDPNPYFERSFRINLKATPGVTLEKYICKSAEDLSDIESDSVDVVVSTLVCCAIPNLQKAYKEIHRVLVPGGKFLYMEHVLDTPGTWLYYKQKFYSITGYWPFVLECNLDRNLDEEILKSGLFSDIDQTRIYLNPNLFQVLSPHVIGTATK